MFFYLFLYQDWALLILRVALGAAFVAHGYPKLFKMFGGVAAWLDSIGIRPGKFWALVVGIVEFFGGVALIFGISTQIVAALIAANMLVAMVKVKWGKTKFVESERMGWELDLIYFASAALITVFGAGSYSLDFYLPFRF